MSLDIESEAVLSKKSATEVEIKDARGRDKVIVKIPEVYGLRKEDSPLTVTLVNPEKSATYFIYATKPAVPRGQSPRASSGFDTVISQSVGLVDKHRYLGAVLTDTDGDLLGMLQDGNEFTLNSKVGINLGKSYTASDTIKLPIPSTASKAILTVSIRSSESKIATARFFVLGEKNPFEAVESSEGETTAEKSFKIPVPDSENQITYKIERSRNTQPALSIQLLGWVDGAL